MAVEGDEEEGAEMVPVGVPPEPGLHGPDKGANLWKGKRLFFLGESETHFMLPSVSPLL